jgi:hypothetical protein
VDETVARLNIEHFRKLLADENDQTKRESLKRLLAAEEEILDKCMKANRKSKSG